MDPCPFVRLIVESLALKLPLATKPAGSGVHPSTTPCFCKLRLKNLPSQTALIPLCSADTSPPDSVTSFSGFHLDPTALRRLSDKPITLSVSVYTGCMGRTCGVSCGKLLGRVSVCINLDGAILRASVFQNGWMKLGSEPANPSAKLHLTVRTEPDPRYVFQFGGEPECSPVVFQIQGNIRQPVFSCKFSADRNSRSRSLPSDFTTNNRVWMRTFSGEREKPGRERKGWMITIHDLSGSSVAAALMITPFVPSPGSDRVSRSNPGAWLIQGASMKPWGRLEAWRERGAIDGLGYKFELVSNTGLTSGVPIAEGTMSLKNGGQFCIDNTIKDSAQLLHVGGFVMGSTVEGEGKKDKNRESPRRRVLSRFSGMESGRYVVVFLILNLVSKSNSQSILQIYPKTHRSSPADPASGDGIYCDSWRFSVETNDAGKWSGIPKRCIHYVKEYMTGDGFRSDSEIVADNSVEFAKTVNVAGDGKDAWVFDIDETLLSNVPYYAAHGYGSEEFDEKSFNDWVGLAEAPALPASLRLYRELEEMGITIFLLTGREEFQRNATEKNLLYAGYTHWEKLFLRGPSDKGKLATTYKSEKRKELEDEGYTLHGCSGDQWSDLLGFSVGKRSFKLPNPMYYIP